MWRAQSLVWTELYLVESRRAAHAIAWRLGRQASHGWRMWLAASRAHGEARRTEEQLTGHAAAWRLRRQIRRRRKFWDRWRALQLVLRARSLRWVAACTLSITGHQRRAWAALRGAAGGVDSH